MPGGYAVWCLCIFGLVKEFRPSESFLTPYLVGPWKNLTQKEVNQEIYPIGTYSTLLMLVVVFLITDVLCYKPVIIVHSLAGVTSYALITFGSSKNYVQTAEIFYGLFVASEVAYSTYIYSSCERDVYRQVTSYTRMALQTGRLLSGSVSQLLTSYGIMNLHQLNFLSLAGLSCSAIFGCLLPTTHKSLYFHRDIQDTSKNIADSQIKCDVHLPPSADSRLLSHNDVHIAPIHSEAEENIPTHIFTSQANPENLSGFNMIWYEFCTAFTNLYVVKWSLWWALTQCGYLQTTSYIQNLWQDTVNVSGGHLYNGAASATYTILGIFATWGAGQIKFHFEEKKSLWLLTLCAAVTGILLVFSAYSYVLLYQYIAYGIYKVFYQVMMIFANSEVAKSLTRDSHGLVFGFNTFLALVLQTALTFTFAGKGGLELTTRVQFFVYGGYYFLISILFGVIASVISLKECALHCQSKSDSPGTNTL